MFAGRIGENRRRQTISDHSLTPAMIADVEKNLSASELYGLRLRAARRALREEYLQPHAKPWIVGFSGGKDSTLLAHLVIECLLSVAPDERRRRVYVCSNDTLVESPVFQEFVNKTLARMAEGLAALDLPVEVVKTTPLPDESFWVNLLGRGYPAPKRMFRWCTDRMKIRPTTRFIQEQVVRNGEAILLLGTRRAESAERAKNIQRREDSAPGSLLNPHKTLKGCLVFTPILNLTTEDVWLTLLNSRPPWGGDHRELVRLYNRANGGECPFVVSGDDPASCGTSSARFGCWTCTVVEKDNSIEAMIEAGFADLEPLADFRNRIKALSENPDCRSKIRRNGQPGLGPLTIETRKLLLEELLALQRRTGLPLITDHEVRLIREHWAKDTTDSVIRELGGYFDFWRNSNQRKNL
jgi:DNA sulfur modification protein DndC